MTVIPFGLVIVSVIVAFLIAANAADAGIVVHAYLFAAAAIAAASALISRNSAARPATAAGPDEVVYNDAIVRYGLVATVFWGVVGFLVGLVIALQLLWPALNFDTDRPPPGGPVGMLVHVWPWLQR